MDSRAHLDHVLFQLTPTRTRCDLVIFAGKKNEKLASGLLEPFLSHLNYARDQISKGGYSITLRPTSSNASWFTKATLERFVRFVSTPEVLERFVTIEKEISHIEDSIEAEGNISSLNGNSKASGTQAKVESNGSADSTTQQNSKVHLLRALETRKAVLRKEQAMAYARALVAGFEMDYIDDLISFSDAFGAKRLRDACNNFMELCNKKSNDRLWADEVARMQAVSPEFSFLGTSGIIIANEANDGGQVDSSISDSTTNSGGSETNNAENGSAKTPAAQATQVPPWAQYMQNFQGPPLQQYPPYQGYYFPGMHPQSYYPGNGPWPPSSEDSSMGHHLDDHRKSKSSKHKKKASNGTSERTPKNSDSNEPSNSSSGSDSDDKEDHGRRHSLDSVPKKSGNKSSRKVVIRNINYITSKRKGERDGSTSGDSSSDEEDGFIDADSLKQQVDEALGSFDKHHKSTSGKKNKKRDGIKKRNNKADNASDHDFEDMPTSITEGEKKSQNWDAFQNLLMRDTDEQVTDTGRSTGEFHSYISNNGQENGPSFTLDAENVPKTRGISTDAFLLDRRSVFDDSKPSIENFEAGESVRAVIKRGNTDELLLSQRTVGSEVYCQDPLSHSGIEPSVMKSQREEDWFAGNRPDGNRESRMSMFNADDSLAFGVGPLQNKENNRDVLVDDSFMIQSGAGFESSFSEQKTDIFLEADMVGGNQNDEHREDDQQDDIKSDAFHEPDDLYMVLGRDSGSDQFAASWNPEMEYNDDSVTESMNKQPESSDPVDAKKVQNGKSTKTTPGGKVPNRPGMSRTTAGSLARSKSEIASKARTTPARSKSTLPKSEQEEEKRKKIEELRLERQRRIAERSATRGATSRMNSREIRKAPVSAASTEDTKKATKPVFRNSTIDRLSAARTTESKPAAQNKKATAKENGPQNKKLIQEKGKPADKKVVVKNSSVSSSVPDAPQNDEKVSSVSSLAKEQYSPKGSFNEAPEEIKNLYSVSSIEKRDFPAPPPAEDHQVKTESLIIHNGEVASDPSVDKEATRTDDHPQVEESNMVSEILTKVAASQISTPPENIAMSPENHTRKKWNDGENSPKVSKGFRKLLLFGRKN